MENGHLSPLVSVLIATYNKASTLRYAIESVLWQTHQDFEVWVIGDHCTDDSAQVVLSFNDPRLNWVNLPENSGYQSVPHNEGLRRASGKYIAYLNHDDIWLPDHLRLLVETLEKGSADFAYSILEWVLPWRAAYADIPTFPDAARPPEASATIHRRTLIDEIGYWKLPHETNTIPRAEYFRRAQFRNKQFVLVPALTVLKFACGGCYDEIGQHEEYAARIRTDAQFAEKELAALLVRSTAELEGPIRLKSLAIQATNYARRSLMRRKIDPASLSIWKRPGAYIRRWRREHQLD